MDLPFGLATGLGEGGEETFAVSVVAEDFLAAIPAIDDMIDGEIPRLLEPPKQSFFLFGPRGTGKSTWVRRHFASALQVNLLDEGLYQELLSRPGGFADRLGALKRGSWVCVDEVQRIPGLLNEVHRLIEERHLKFVMLGSSARKLRRAGVNLLAGRALRRSMHPFLPMELGSHFSLSSALEVGTLPIAFTTPWKLLKSTSR